MVKALCHSLMDSVFFLLSDTSEKVCFRVTGKWYKFRLMRFRKPLPCYREDRPSASFDDGFTRRRFSTELAGTLSGHLYVNTVCPNDYNEQE